ncbi:MAG: polysaccharide deacetylase family protein [bacterium]
MEILLIASLVGALIVTVFRMNHLESRLLRLSKSSPFQIHASSGSLNGKRHKSDLHEAAFNIISPAKNVTIREESFRIVGEAPENYVVALSRGGKLLQAVVPQKGEFIFPNLTSLNGQANYVVRAIDPEGNVSIIEERSYKFIHKAPAITSSDFSRGSILQRKVALTFDGGSLANAVDPILEVLSRYSVKSTMFLTGSFIEKYPEAVKKIANMGHEVGNHTWDHLHLTSYADDKKQITLPELNKETLQKQLQRTGDLFAEVTGGKMQPFWRAPFGEHNGEIRRWAAEVGYRHVGWTSGKTYSESLDTVDWIADSSSTAYRSSQEILQKFIDRIDRNDGDGLAGGIILMHLGTQRMDDPVHQILPTLIEALLEQNFQLVPVSDLISGRS